MLKVFSALSLKPFGSNFKPPIMFQFSGLACCLDEVFNFVIQLLWRAVICSKSKSDFQIV